MKKRYWIGTAVATILLVIMACIIAYFKGNVPGMYERHETAFTIVIWCIVGLWAIWQVVNAVLAIIEYRHTHTKDKKR
ncbi:MAG: hypothetical protein NC132_06525 [Corallococcus sp.]|nr:hypothetical protein [Corallococcus sp.]MCM1395739.1 hypothetical protein [Corallococcus sp.]